MELGLLLRIVTWLMLLLCLSYGVSSSNSNQKSGCDDGLTSYEPCFGRYVVEPFFKQHNGSSDSCLQEYIVHKIPFGSHAIVPVMLDLERRLIGEGSHRRLASYMRLTIQPVTVVDFSSQICEIIFIDRLPSGVFADPFELQHLLQRGVFKDASVFGDTNLELPSFLSNRSVVEVHLDAALSRLAEQEIIAEFKIEIPLHARYPPLEEHGYSNVKFGVPDVFMRCKINKESPIQTDPTCLITPVASNDSVKIEDIVWSVPAGIKAHAGIVSIVTFTSAILSVTFIVLASLRHAGIESKARFKQS